MDDAGEKRPRLREAAREAKASRERRLALVMRQNLLKRKAQQRLGAAGRETRAAPEDPSEPEPA